MSSLGQRIREHRIKKGLTQIKLAKGIVTPSMISQIEADRAHPSYQVLFALSSRLEVPIEDLLHEVDLQTEASSKYKMAISMVRAKKFQAAIPFLTALLETSQHRIPRSNLLLELALCQLELGQPEQAECQLNELYLLANAEQNDRLLVSTLLYLGMAGAAKKDYPMALFHTNRAWDMLQKEEIKDPDLQMKTLMQIGKLHEGAGRVAVAVTYYEKAMLLVPGSSEERGNMYLRLAEMYNRLKHYERAEQYAVKSSVIFEEQTNMEQSFEMKRRLLVLKRGSIDLQATVLELLTLARKHEHDDNQDPVGAVYADLALLYFEHQKFEDAKTNAVRAERCLSEKNPALGIACRILSQIALHSGELKTSKEYFDKAVKIFEQHNMVSELEEITTHICHYLNDQGAHREAFERLERTHRYMITQLAQRGIVL